MIHKSTLNGWLLAAIVIAGLSQGFATADIVVPRATDPAEHAAMMKLAAIIRHTNYNKTAELLKERPEWKYTPMMQAKLAFALFKLNKPKADMACRAICEELISKYGKSDPVAAAWAQSYIIRCLVRKKWMVRTWNYTEALDRSMEVLESCNAVEDMTPVLAVQRGLGCILSRQKKLFKEGIETDRVAVAAAKYNGAKYDGANALVTMARCSDMAERGEMENAKSRLLTLTQMLPAGDRRIALASTGLVISACIIYDRDPSLNFAMLPHCDQIIAALENACPKEQWLIARAKLTFADAIFRSRTDNKKAERYFREAVDNKSVPDLLPEAYTQLARILFAQQQYAEAADTLKVVVDSYPYSTWVDYATYLRADCIYRSGKNNEAISLFDELILNYPESGWCNVAKLQKEAASK